MTKAKGARKVHSAVDIIRRTEGLPLEQGEVLFEAPLCMPKVTEVGWRPPANQVRTTKDEDVTCGTCLRILAKPKKVPRGK